MADDPQALLTTVFEAAVAAAQPATRIPAALPAPPKGRTIVVGAGKASAAMARAVEDSWQGPLSGLVVTRYGHAVPCQQIEVVEAAHPVPDRAGLGAAERMLAAVADLTPDDLVLCLISGGGSALLTLPAGGLTLEDKQAVNRALLASGATISEMNCVRRHLSAVKGGRLAAAAAPARVVSLLISDVPGDDPADIASGPTVPDPTTFAEARAVLEKYGIAEPAAAIAHLRAAQDETPKPGDNRLAGAETAIVACPHESRDVALVHAAIALQTAKRGQPFPPPALLLSGGETTVTLRGAGRGGPNAEFLLALAIALDGAAGIHALACDTDGVDGSEDNAGARLAPDSLARAAALGLDARRMLADNDGYGFFQGLGDLVMTGPTLTNVNDFRAILIAG